MYLRGVVRTKRAWLVLNLIGNFHGEVVTYTSQTPLWYFRFYVDHGHRSRSRDKFMMEKMIMSRDQWLCCIHYTILICMTITQVIKQYSIAVFIDYSYYQGSCYYMYTINRRIVFTQRCMARAIACIYSNHSFWLEKTDIRL